MQVENRNYISAIIIFISVFITKEAISQTTGDNCGEIVHGVHDLDLDCSDDILVTSLEVDGYIGTIITGIITTLDSSKIRILPGYTSVRIIPVELNSHSMGLRTHTTKLGNGGKTGKSVKADDIEISLNKLILFPNPSKNKVNIQSSANKIIGFQLADLYGTIIKKEDIKPVFKYSLTTHQLKTGMYWLTIQLETGTLLTKKLFKN